MSGISEQVQGKFAGVLAVPVAVTTTVSIPSITTNAISATEMKEIARAENQNTLDLLETMHLALQQLVLGMQVGIEEELGAE